MRAADAVVNLSGEPIAQRWTDAARRRIEASRTEGTRRLVAAIASAKARPSVLVSASAVGYYGARGDEERLDRGSASRRRLSRPPLRPAWEGEAAAALLLGVRVVRIRTGVVLAADGGALAKMLPPFRLGVGGPVAGGRQYVAWIAAARTCVGLYLARWTDRALRRRVQRHRARAGHQRGARARARSRAAPARGTARAGGRAASRYGSMAQIVTDSQNAVPERALGPGYRFARPALDGALTDALR